MAFYEDIIISKDGRTECVICKIYLENNTIEKHIENKNHKDLYIRRLLVQNNIVIHENKAHCFICNINLSNLITHIKGSQHQELIHQINSLIENDGAFLELPCNLQKSNSNIHCTICDVHLNFNLESIEGHVNSTNHKRARSMAVQPFNGICSIEGSDNLWCKICQVSFENYIEVIFEHVDEDKEHNTRLAKILGLIEGHNISLDKYLTNPTEDKATCNKCATEVSCNVDNLQTHIKGKKHNRQNI